MVYIVPYCRLCLHIVPLGCHTILIWLDTVVMQRPVFAYDALWLPIIAYGRTICLFMNPYDCLGLPAVAYSVHMHCQRLYIIL